MPIRYTPVVTILLSFFQISKLHLLIDVVTSSYDKFFFGDVGREIYDFFWGDFADWYVMTLF
jgi:valyl-tRNA synthetase